MASFTIWMALVTAFRLVTATGDAGRMAVAAGVICVHKLTGCTVAQATGNRANCTSNATGTKPIREVAYVTDRISEVVHESVHISETI